MLSRRGRLTLAGVFVVGLVFLWTGTPLLGRLHAQGTSIVPVSREVDEAKAELKKLGEAPRAFVLISRIIRPSVVSVLTERKVTMRGRRSPFPWGDDWPFEGPNPFRERDRKVSGMGSGVMVDKQGHILTNNHVVAGAEEITVQLPDESEYTAELVGTDPKTDLAVIKLKDCPAEKIIPAKLGDSDKLDVGDWVLAVGAPFGLTQSVSAGIVSATGRTNVRVIPRDDRYQNFIQTDAAINRGNSGGPLVNYKAEVVGINTAIATQTGGYEGVGFAIPSRMAKDVMSQLIANGRVVRGYLGVVIRQVLQEDVEKLKLPGREGVVVEGVNPDTPAAKAGIEKGDVIVAIDDVATPRMVQLRSRIANTKPGTTVKVRVLRDGKPKTIAVAIQEQPDEIRPLMTSAADDDLGITIQTLTEDVASRLEVGGKVGVYKDEKGVLVTAVAPGSPAHRAGIRPKDLIKEVSNQAVADVTEYNRARKGLDLKKGVLLLVKTGDMAKLVLVK